jgi:hypothetical protein
MIGKFVRINDNKLINAHIGVVLLRQGNDNEYGRYEIYWFYKTHMKETFTHTLHDYISTIRMVEYYEHWEKMVGSRVGHHK